MCCRDIETSQLICCVNQLTGFYIMATHVKMRCFKLIAIFFSKFEFSHLRLALTKCLFFLLQTVEDGGISQTNFFVEDELADKRHIGIPDHGGVQRILQTGSVAASLDTGNPNDLRDKFDIIFATYYIEPSHVRAIRPEDKKCIEEYRQKAAEGEVHSARFIRHIHYGKCY